MRYFAVGRPRRLRKYRPGFQGYNYGSPIGQTWNYFTRCTHFFRSFPSIRVALRGAGRPRSQLSACYSCHLLAALVACVSLLAAYFLVLMGE